MFYRLIVLCLQLSFMPATLSMVTAFFCLQCALPERRDPECQKRFSAASFLEHANRLRASEETDALAFEPALMKQAVSWAEYNSEQEQRTHYDNDGRGPLERLKQAGLKKRMVAENIATAPVSMDVLRILESWKGKREEENVMNPLYRFAGFGVARARTGCVIVLMLSE